MNNEPVDQEAHDLLLKYGWKFLGSDDESGYDFPGQELTLIVSPSGAWRVIKPTSYREHLLVCGLPDELEEWLKEFQEEKKNVGR